MLNPKEEAQNIRRVETIMLEDIDSIKTCDDLLDICLEIMEKININISDFIISNKVFGYSQEFNINDGIENIVKFKNYLIEKKKVIKDLECLKEEIINFNQENNISDILNLTGVYYMYIGRFSKGLSVIKFSSFISGIEENKVVTDVEELNEFIFKYNFSVDITKLENYKEACEVLQYYYNKGFRLERGDQLLIILYNNLRQGKKSRKVLDTICNISNNALFHYEIGKAPRRRVNKFKAALGIILLLCITGGFVFTIVIPTIVNTNLKPSSNNIASNSNKDTKPTDKTVNIKKEETPKEDVKPKEEENKSNEDVKNVEAIDLKTLGLMVNSMSDEANVEYLTKQISLIEKDEKIKDSKEFSKIKSEFNKKAQALYYNSGRQYYKEGNIDSAIKTLKLAYDNRSGEYLDSHITYYLASAVNKKNPTEALKYYKEYIDNYSKDEDSYADEALYNMVMINLNAKNPSEAKKYARKLSDKYPKSMYNNEKIKAIL